MDTPPPPKDSPDSKNETVGIPDGMAEHDPKGAPTSDRQQTETGPHQS